MEKNSKKDYKKPKILFIIMSIIVVLFSLTDYVLTSDRGAVLLTSFESFYIYIVTILISIYLIMKNKNANIVIIISILTYGWTYYLVQQMIEYVTEVNINIELNFYIYLSSSIFLIISLFFNDKKEIHESIPTNFENSNTDITNDLNKDNFIFVKFILGQKNISLNTDMLLVNNIPDNSLDLIYASDNISKTIKIPISSIKNISYKISVTMKNISKKTESNEMKSMLLSAAVFGGNPMLQLAGNSAFNSIFDGISNNYDKVNFNSCYEIIIEISTGEQEIKYIFNTDTNPEMFTKQLLEVIK